MEENHSKQNSNAENSGEAPSGQWRRCSSCKKWIALNSRYYVCSVSTCNGLRTGYVFCSVDCFERHLPGARHKDAGAVEKLAPKVQDLPVVTGVPGGQRIIVRSQSAEPSGVRIAVNNAGPQEVLVIASRLKEYISARSDFNTSAGVMDVLSEHLRLLCDRAIDSARTEGRKTVMDRDFEFLKTSRFL